MFKFTQKILAAILAFFAVFIPPAPVEPVTPDHPLVNVNPNPISETVSAQDVTVMSFNLRYGGSGKKSVATRMPLVVQLILDHKLDSFGTQEATKEWADGLCEALPDYARVGKFRDDGISQGESSSIFYLKDKYELLETGDFWLSKTPDVPSKDWDAGHNRILTYAILKNKETGFIYAHFNTHFDNASAKARTESVAIVTAKIAEIAPDIPVVLTGDLNFSEGCADYNNLLACGLRDSKYMTENRDNCATYHGYYPVSYTNNPIDFVFVNGYASAVESYFVDTRMPDFTYPSDHFPIIVKMTLTNGGEK